MALTTRIKVDATAVLTGSPDMGSNSATLSLSYARDLSSGTATGQADLVFTDSNTLAASGTIDYDLAGSLLTALGAAFLPARIKAIVLEADAGNTNNVVLGGAASAQFVGPFGATTHTVAVPPGGAISMVAPGTTGWPVTATTADLLRVANSGGTTGVTYKILIIGASA